MRIFRYWGISILFLGVLYAQHEIVLYVNEVYFVGNNAIPERNLSKIVNLKSSFLFSKTEFDRRILKLDAITIKNRYKTNGYLNAAVRDSFVTNVNIVDIYFLIDEGKQSFINNIILEGNKKITERKILKKLGLRKNRAFNPVVLNTNIASIEEAYHQIGKLFSVIDINTEVVDSVNIRITINEGPDVYINKIFIEGSDSSKLYAVNRDLYFKMGDLYDLDRILLSQRRLLETGQFSVTNIYPVKHAQSDTMVNMVVEVKYFPKREISSEGGFVPIEFGGLMLSGPGAFLQWKNRSLFGTTTRLSAKSSIDIPTEYDLQYPRFKIDFNLENQWLLNLRFPTKVQTLYELYKKYGSSDSPFIQRYGFNWSSVNRITETSFVELGVRWEKFSQQEGGGSDVEQRMISIRSKLDYSDHPLFPTQGVVVTGDIYSVGGPLGGTRDYQKVDTGIQTYIPMPRRIVFAARVKYGAIFNWKENYDTYEDVLFEKFYLGGTKSLRGWNALQYPDERKSDIHLNGKEIRFLTSFELRFPVFGPLGAEIFTDGGQIWDNSSEISLSDLSWNVGAGLTYTSPLGPVRLDFAYKIDNPYELDPWEVLLDVLYAF